MNVETAKTYLLAKPDALESFPFGPEARVFKVKNKVFAILSEFKGAPSVNLKCEPEEAMALRDIFESVIPGYHMNKKHWNTVILDREIPEGEIERMMDRSYGLIVKGLTRAERAKMELVHGADALYK
jgi:predicted DNA-binding protein (MmcQ/YjbR family)